MTYDEFKNLCTYYGVKPEECRFKPGSQGYMSCGVPADVLEADIQRVAQKHRDEEWDVFLQSLGFPPVSEWEDE